MVPGGQVPVGTRGSAGAGGLSPPPRSLQRPVSPLSQLARAFGASGRCQGMLGRSRPVSRGALPPPVPSEGAAVPPGCPHGQPVPMAILLPW